MKHTWLTVACLAAGALLTGTFAACTQDFSVFEPTGGSGQGGATSSANVSGPGVTSSTGGPVTSSSSASSSVSAQSSTTSGPSSSSSSSSSSAQSSSASGPMPTCGDGTTDPGEDCDDGNTLSGDGCSSSCAIEDHDKCPVDAIPLDVGMITIQADTSNAGNDTGSPPCGGSVSGDLVYGVTPAQNGMLTATLDGNFTTLLYARNACPGKEGQNLQCSQQGQMPSTISMGVQSGKTVYVFVDGYGQNKQEGPFTLTLELK